MVHSYISISSGRRGNAVKNGTPILKIWNRTQIKVVYNESSQRQNLEIAKNKLTLTKQLLKVWQEEILHLESSRICKIRFCKKFIALSAKLCKAHTDTTKLAVLERNTLKRSRKRNSRLKITIGMRKKKEKILFSSGRQKSSWDQNGNPHLISEQLWFEKTLKCVGNIWIGKLD